MAETSKSSPAPAAATAGNRDTATAKNGGAGAIGAAAVVLLSHGSDYDSSEVTLLTAGAAALCIWLAGLFERAIAWCLKCRAEAKAAGPGWDGKGDPPGHAPPPLKK